MKRRFWIAGKAEPYEVAVEQGTFAPSRPKRDSWVTRVTDGLARWSMEDTTGYGIAEHLAHQKPRDE